MMASMRALAVDTTGAHGSVALVAEGELVALVGIRETSPRHAERLLPTIESLLGRLSLELSQIDGFAVAVGPGSFTGLRIGIASVEGLSFATGKPVAGVSALEATAFRFRHLPGLIVSIIEAYRGEVYGAAYRSRSGLLQQEVEPVCATASDFLAALPEPPSIVAGTAIVRHREAIERSAPGVRMADASFFLAEEVARIGEAKLAAGGSAPLGGLTPIYIRPPEAERKLSGKARPG
jgi:tRNA threonylcarbamoyl adenosine modification protein YeaZ